VLCGGGVAGIEALLALRALLEVLVEVHPVEPNHQFVYQPLAVAAPFDLAETHLFDLSEIAREQSAELHVDSLARVDAEGLARPTRQRHRPSLRRLAHRGRRSAARVAGGRVALRWSVGRRSVPGAARAIAERLR